MSRERRGWLGRCSRTVAAIRWPNVLAASLEANPEAWFCLVSERNPGNTWQLYPGALDLPGFLATMSHQEDASCRTKDTSQPGW